MLTVNKGSGGLSQYRDFDGQVAKLVATGLWKKEIFSSLREIFPRGGDFLVVPPQQTRNFRDVMKRVVLNGVLGWSYYRRVRDIVEVPANTSYLLMDIEDGRERLNVRPSRSEAQIQEEGRSPYTGWEGVIHCLLFPEVLQHHALDLLGSRDSDGYLVGININGAEPTFCEVGGVAAGASEGIGAPSCRVRVGAF